MKNGFNHNVQKCFTTQRLIPIPMPLGTVPVVSVSVSVSVNAPLQSAPAFASFYS